MFALGRQVIDLPGLTMTQSIVTTQNGGVYALAVLPLYTNQISQGLSIDRPSAIMASSIPERNDNDGL